MVRVRMPDGDLLRPARHSRVRLLKLVKCNPCDKTHYSESSEFSYLYCEYLAFSSSCPAPCNTKAMGVATTSISSCRVNRPLLTNVNAGPSQ